MLTSGIVASEVTGQHLDAIHCAILCQTKICPDPSPPPCTCSGEAVYAGINNSGMWESDHP